MLSRNELRDRFDAGDVGQHEVARGMCDLNRALEDYAALLPRTDVAAIVVRDGVIEFESRIAPVRFRCDVGDPSLPPLVALALGCYEPVEMRLLRELLPGARGFLDVGANIGWYSLHAASLFPDLRVVAAELVPTTAAILSHNVELNGARVEVVSKGLSDAVGEVEVWASPQFSGSASVAPSREYAGARPQRAPVTTLDALVDEYGLSVDVLKADVEGGELAVLRGGLRTIERDRPAMMLELLRIHAAPFGYHPNDVLDLLAGFGYETWALSPAGIRRFERMTEATEETNFLFLHRDSHAAISVSRAAG